MALFLQLMENVNTVDDTLCSYYKFERMFKTHKIKNFVFNYTQLESVENWESAIKETEKIFQLGKLYLFVSLNTERIWERKMAFSDVLCKKYGVIGDTVVEWSADDAPYGIRRVGVLKIRDYSPKSVFKLLFTLQFSSFAMIKETDSNEELWIAELLKGWKGEFLTPDVMCVCCDSITSHDAVFMYLLKGCDGFSINYIYPTHL